MLKRPVHELPVRTRRWVPPTLPVEAGVTQSIGVERMRSTSRRAVEGRAASRMSAFVT